MSVAPDASIVANAFAHAYVSGDTRTACGLAVWDAVPRLVEAGLCVGRAGWSAIVELQEHCIQSEQEERFMFLASAPVDNEPRFEVRASLTGGEWVITSLIRTDIHDNHQLCE